MRIQNKDIITEYYVMEDYQYFASAGANISLPEFANLTEGERIEVCITITDDEQPLRRDILLSFSVIPNNIFSCKLRSRFS